MITFPVRVTRLGRVLFFILVCLCFIAMTVSLGGKGVIFLLYFYFPDVGCGAAICFSKDPKKWDEWPIMQRSFFRSMLHGVLSEWAACPRVRNLQEPCPTYMFPRARKF